MDYENAAKTILSSLHIEYRQDYIDGIVKMLRTQESIINAQWEAFLDVTTNDILALDNICCSKCNAPIQITRTRDIIYIGEEYEQN
jgi:hypothetical protein